MFKLHFVLFWLSDDAGFKVINFNMSGEDGLDVNDAFGQVEGKEDYSKEDVEAFVKEKYEKLMESLYESGALKRVMTAMLSEKDMV